MITCNIHNISIPIGFYLLGYVGEVHVNVQTLKCAAVRRHLYFIGIDELGDIWTCIDRQFFIKEL
jgi:hypothetical protein